MAYDPGLAERIREHFSGRFDVSEKKMFGGLCFMMFNHMCCGIIGDTLMARVGPARYDELLARRYAKEMDFTGKAMKGMIYVDSEGLAEDVDLGQWLDNCSDFVLSLPAKAPKKKK